jgi:hypothetical protein
MDDSIFYAETADYATLMNNEEGALCIFYFCYRQLERVSLNNAKFYIFGEAPQVVPQSALFKFARCTPNLLWVRSDLTRNSYIAILRAQRPQVTFT